MPFASFEEYSDSYSSLAIGSTESHLWDVTEPTPHEPSPLKAIQLLYHLYHLVEVLTSGLNTYLSLEALACDIFATHVQTFEATMGEYPKTRPNSPNGLPPSPLQGQLHFMAVFVIEMVGMMGAARNALLRTGEHLVYLRRFGQSYDNLLRAVEILREAAHEVSLSGLSEDGRVVLGEKRDEAMVLWVGDERVGLAGWSRLREKVEEWKRADGFKVWMTGEEEKRAAAKGDEEEQMAEAAEALMSLGDKGEEGFVINGN